MIKNEKTISVSKAGATRSDRTGKGRFDLLPPQALQKVAIHFEEGGLQRGDRNWEKGIPLARFIDSALRHIFKELSGADDENHMEAAAWNILCYIETRERISLGQLPVELDDLPDYRTREQKGES